MEVSDMTKRCKVLIVMVEVLIFTTVIVLITLSIKNHGKRYFEVTAESSLTRVLEINELHTLEYRYNSYAVVYATRYNMEVYDEYKDIITTVMQEYAQYKKETGQSYEQFRQEKLSILQDDVYYDFYNLCITQEDFDALKQFLGQTRKNAAKMMNNEKYAVAYEGIITAGIKKDITFTIDRDAKLVTVVVPRAEIIDVNVRIPADKETKSVIYTDQKYVNTDTWIKEAQTACRLDLQQKIALDMEFLNLATENARDAIVALLTPFEKQSGYKFVVEVDL